MIKLIKISIMLLLICFSMLGYTKQYWIDSYLLERLERGDTSAMLEVARQFSPSSVVYKPVKNQKKDIEFAIELYSKIIDANDFNSYAARKELQQLYCFSDEIIQKYARECVFWSENYPISLDEFDQIIRFATLGRIYRKGIGGVKKDLNKALEYYSIIESEDTLYLINAELQGEIKDFDSVLKKAQLLDIKAMTLVGIMYWKGEYTQEDRKAAKMWLQRVFEKTQEPQILFWLSELEINKAKRFQMAKKAADQGNSHAQDRVAGFYYGGHGTGIDKKKAKEYGRLACENGYARACSNYNLFYSKDIDAE